MSNIIWRDDAGNEITPTVEEKIDGLAVQVAALSIEVLDALMPLVPQDDIGAFATKLDEFLAAKHSVVEKVYEKARELGMEDAETPAFLFQPEVLLIYNLLSSSRDKTRRVWNEKYPERELERIANAFGVSLD